MNYGISDLERDSNINLAKYGNVVIWYYGNIDIWEWRFNDMVEGLPSPNSAGRSICSAPIWTIS